MENIITVEKLCDILQSSDKPTELGIGIALRVVLDEHTTLSEQKEELSKLLKAEKICTNFFKQELYKYTNLCVETQVERNLLRKEKAELLVKLAQRDKQIEELIILENSKIQERVKEVRAKHEAQKLKRAIQTSIEFPQEVKPSINDRVSLDSVYERAAKRRARYIWKYAKEVEVSKWVDGKLKAEEYLNLDFIGKTKHIIDWYNVFFTGKITYNHVEIACLPKRAGGKGTKVGMDLEKAATRYKNLTL